MNPQLTAKDQASLLNPHAMLGSARLGSARLGSARLAHDASGSILSPRLSLLLAFSFFISAFLLPLPSARANWVWLSNPSSSNWATVANWGVQTGSTLEFSNSTITSLNNNAGTGPLTGILIDPNAPAYTFSGNAIGITGGITNNSSNLLTINSGIQLGFVSFNYIVTSAGGGNVTVGGVISGGYELHVNGTGTTTFTANNTYTASTVLDGGAGDTLVVNGGVLSGAVAGSVILGSNTAGNTLIFTNGASANSAVTALGYLTASSNNTLLVSGTNTVITNSQFLYVGLAGSSNSMVISNGGAVTSLSTLIGYINTSSNNTLIITGPNSALTNTGVADPSNIGLSVGYLDGGGNELVVSNGASITELNSIMVLGGGVTSSNNTLIVTGTNSSIVDNGANSMLAVGNWSSGNKLIISNGASVLDTNGAISDASVATNNYALITGTGSLWSNSGYFKIGAPFVGIGNGTLTVANSGSLVANGGIVVQSGSGSSTLNIGTPGGSDLAGTIVSPTIALNTAGGSQLNFNQVNTTTVTSTISGVGIVDQFGSGTTILTAANTYSGGTYLSNTGTLAISNNASLGTGTVTFDNSTPTLMALANLKVTNNTVLSNGVVGIMNSGTTGAYLFTNSGAITGAGQLGVAGTGTLYLVASNAYTGTTTVAGGTSTLEVGTSGKLSGTTSVAVNGGTLLLEGNGQVNPINPSATLTTATGSTIMMGDISQATTRASSQSFTSLTLSGNTVINFSALAGLSTLQLSALTMNGNSLTVLNWEGTTYYGSVVGTPANDTHLMDLTGLSQANLNNISFYSGGTTSSGFLGTAIFSLTNANEIIPVPEPSVVISGLFLLGWLIAGAARGRKKLS